MKWVKYVPTLLAKLYPFTLFLNGLLIHAQLKPALFLP
jgi:hypothetical protein